MSVVPYTGSLSRERAMGRLSRAPSDDRSCFSREIVPRERPRTSARSLLSKFLVDNDDDLNVFGSSRNMFGQMDRMMGAMMQNSFAQVDPFYQGSAYPALMAPQPPSQDLRLRNRDPFGFPGLGLGSLMPTMENMARDGSCHSYSSSSVMTMTTGPDGRPQVYQATASSLGAPGGVRETKRTVSDSTTGVRQMAIGHHINDRSHVIEKEMRRDGAVEERQEFVNLDEEEAPKFDQEFRQRTQQGLGAIEHRPRFRNERPAASSPSRQRYLPALPSSSSYRRRTRPTLGITTGSRY